MFFKNVEGVYFFIILLVEIEIFFLWVFQCFVVFLYGSYYANFIIFLDVDRFFQMYFFFLI